MGMLIYPALVDEADPASLQARIPDFGDAEVHAASPVELMLRARELLAQRLEQLEQAGEPWPTASPLAETRAKYPGHTGAVIWVDVEVEDTPVRVTISIGERLLARIDAAAEEHAMTRSGFLAASARRQIALGGSPLDGPTGQKLYEEVTAAGRRIHETLGPESPVGRALAELDAIALDGLRRLAGGVSDVLRPRRDRQSRADKHG